MSQSALDASSWASGRRPPRSSSTPGRGPTPSQNAAAPPPSHADDIAKLHRLLVRLQWRADSLLCSWSRARDMTLAAAAHPHAFGAFTPDLHNPNPAAAPETMFKLDFFEFYVLLERAIVLALALVGTRVSRGSAATIVDSTPSTADSAPATEFIFATRGRSLITPTQPLTRTTITSVATHRFHANLLTTLDRTDCPLHVALGRGEARRQLGLAKEYRNRWKDADEDGAGREEGGPLDLEGMLAAVLAGLGKAVDVAGRMPVGSGVRGQAEEQMVDESMEDGAAPWEAVEDAMEWE